MFEGEEGLRRLRRLADLQVKRQLEPIKGIAAVKVKGGLEEEIHVLLQEEQLRRTGLSIQQVIDRLAMENINVAGGTIQEGRTEYLVRTLNEYADLRQMERTIIAVFDGRDVRLSDLGEVKRAHRERQIVTRTDGGESVQIEIYKEADANIVDLARRVKQAVGSVQLSDHEADADSTVAERSPARAPPRSAASGLAERLFEEEGALLQVVADRSLFIESSIREVRNTAMLGGLLAIMVLFLFLRVWRTTFIVATSIPVSLLIAFAPLHLLDVSLNIMSLGGLALGIGMLVDSSIVVLESIHRCREEGDGLVDAAVRGTLEVRSAVVASTLTTIAVFFPMVFVEGVAGQAFGDLGIAVVVSLAASLAVAIWFIPMLASRAPHGPSTIAGDDPTVPSGAGRRSRAWAGFTSSWARSSVWVRLLIVPILYWTVRLLIGLVLEILGWLILTIVSIGTWTIRRVLGPTLRLVVGLLAWIPLWITERALGALQGVYPRVLRTALRQPVVVVLVILGLFMGTLGILRSLDSELLPEVRQGEFTFEVTLPVGTPLEETRSKLEPIEQAILEEREHIRSLIVTYGFDPTQSDRSDEGEHTARFKILLEGRGRRAGDEDQVVDRLRRRFVGLPDITSSVTRPVLFSSRTPIEVEVHGDDLRELRSYTDDVRTLMEAMPTLADVQTPLQRGAPEIQVVYDRDRLMRYGLGLGEVARLVRDKVQGFEATRFNRVDRRIPIVVRLSDEDRATVEDVRTMVVNPGGERPIRLESVAEVRLGEGPSEVRRIDGQRVGLVLANIGEGSLGSAVATIEGTLRKQVDWPVGMNFFISGQSEEWDRSRGSLFLALGLSIFLVYVIMAIQFESLMHPFVILFSIPLAFIGTVIALSWLNIPLSVVVFLGMIMLAGIVVNNAIVLVDYVNQLRRRGMDREEAIVTAGSIRLRPILMTTATTVLGLLPMALGLGDGAEIRTPMAISVISGLLSSTVLTLIIVPSVYSVLDTVSTRLRRQFGQEIDAATSAATPEEARP
jgi:HAE1 family hydrophobic/amphiphilic exporter-1